MTTTRYLSCAETAKLVRQALKESFPSVKFSVRSRTYAGGASIDIGWKDGPTSKQVEAVSGTFEGAYFDGMIDYQGSRYHALDGEPVRFGANFIFEYRDYSDSMIDNAIAHEVDYWGVGELSDDMPARADWVKAFRHGELYRVRRNNMCDSLQSAVNVFLSGNVDEAFANAKPSPTLERVKFTGDDGYGAGTVGRDGTGRETSNGYPKSPAVTASASPELAEFIDPTGALRKAGLLSLLGRPVQS